MVICGGLAAQLTTAAFLLLYSKHTSSFPASPYLFLLLECSAITFHEGFPGSLAVKNPPANAGDMGLIPGSGRSPGGGNRYPLQYSCLENPMDRGAWQVTVRRVTKSQIQLSMGASRSPALRWGLTLTRCLLNVCRAH